jgi:hypothetical protein
MATSFFMGFVDYLIIRPQIQYTVIVEIDKMKKSDQVVLLNLMETGTLDSTKVRAWLISFHLKVF